MDHVHTHLQALAPQGVRVETVLGHPDHFRIILLLQNKTYVYTSAIAEGFLQGLQAQKAQDAEALKNGNRQLAMFVMEYGVKAETLDGKHRYYAAIHKQTLQSFNPNGTIEAHPFGRDGTGDEIGYTYTE